MGKARKVIIQVVAIMLLLGILTVEVYGLYICMDELDRPASLMKTDSVSNYIEINGFNIRRDALIHDEVVDKTKNKVVSGLYLFGLVLQEYEKSFVTLHRKDYLCSQ